MWIQIDEEHVSQILAGKLDSAVLRYIQERVEHYHTVDTPVAEKFREGARMRLAEVDSDAVVSMGDDAGAYVMAWVWVTNKEAGFPDEDADGEPIGSEYLTMEDLAASE